MPRLRQDNGKTGKKRFLKSPALPVLRQRRDGKTVFRLFRSGETIRLAAKNRLPELSKQFLPDGRQMTNQEIKNRCNALRLLFEHNTLERIRL
jgi:hypothetical protein